MDRVMEGLYRSALYRVDAIPPFVLRVGQYSDALNALFLDKKCQSAAFLTACNPMGVNISDTLNRQAQQELTSDIRDLGFASTAAIGLDSTADSDWPGEPSLFVPGLSKHHAMRLGAKYLQLAIVWCPSTSVPELVVLEYGSNPRVNL